MRKPLLWLRTEPAEWTEEHEAMKAAAVKLGIERGEAYPGWIILKRLIEDVDGLPAAVEEKRWPTLSSSPPRSVEKLAVADAAQERLLEGATTQHAIDAYLSGNLRWFADFDQTDPDDPWWGHECGVRLDAEKGDEARAEAERLAAEHQTHVIRVYREEDAWGDDL